MNNNLPPGCNSSDGGIDHDFDRKIEQLLDAITSIEEIDLIMMALPLLKKIYSNGFKDGKSYQKHLFELGQGVIE